MSRHDMEDSTKLCQKVAFCTQNSTRVFFFFASLQNMLVNKRDFDTKKSAWGKECKADLDSREHFLIYDT